MPAFEAAGSALCLVAFKSEVCFIQESVKCGIKFGAKLKYRMLRALKKPGLQQCW